MIFNYHCSTDESKTESWQGEIHLLKNSDPYEMTITARHSSFHVICGSYDYGNFLCIPSLGIGSELAGLNDTFWNLERLTVNHPNFSEVDAISIIYGLKAISSHLAI